ncbi:MAG: DUF4037 domain-containing protein [Syntrophaceae bacterium]|nr:DUF4037 domain-containing protein [Syntrophaceae bacterium]
MNGLTLCEQYFHKHGLPMIRESFPAHAERIACGLVGDGSECFGFDDEISRDHDWGPGFCMWLTIEDYDDIAKDLMKKYDQLPETFLGYGPRRQSEWGSERVGVFEIGNFFSRYIGYKTVPQKNEEWMIVPESSLAAATNGKVFYDPFGEFSYIRDRLLQFYPEDVRLKKIAARCMTIAQSGQYNLERSLKRGDQFAVRYAETKFCVDVISLIFLLNRRYTPFYKWISRTLVTLPRLGREIHEKVESLIKTPEPQLKPKLVEDICSIIIAELKTEGLTDSSSTFLLDHGPIIQSKIQDKKLRERNVWIG